MNEITSVANEKIKEVVKLQQKKYRVQSERFLVEGRKCIEEAAVLGAEILDVFVLKGKENKYDFVKEKLTLVSEHVMKKITATESPCEAAAVIKRKDLSLDEIKKLHKIALFDNIKDAGNLGTIIRSASAFGIEAVVLTGDCVDIHNPKVIRAAAGNFFKMPIVQLDDKDLKNTFQNHTLIATVVNSESTAELSKLTLDKPFVIMFGSEAQGLGEDILSQADIKTAIAMNENVESLNLSVASAIVFYEIYKLRDCCCL